MKKNLYVCSKCGSTNLADGNYLWGTAPINEKRCKDCGLMSNCLLIEKNKIKLFRKQIGKQKNKKRIYKS